MKQHNILMLLLVLVLVILTVSSCSDELVRFSVCLPFVSASPNNLTDTPPLQCCAEFSSAQSLCLCYLLRPPPILAFPINSSRFFQLPSLCPNASIPHFSLESLCSGSPVLPPLHSITGELNDNVASEPAADSPTEPKTEMPTSTRSSTTMLMKDKCHWGPLSVIFFCLSWSGTSYLMNI
ncbi:hypothetical protein Leryth_016989 [Lithospermum erythrorhizon]|nr:hypothetical protein Leryth_016989 [Lithospermum erythrorhizon]